MAIKNIMSKKVLPFLYIPLFLVASSCTHGYDDINSNHHDTSEEIMTQDNLKTGAFFKQLQRSVVIFKDGKNNDSDYQISQGLSGDIYSGYLSPTGSWHNGKHNGSYYFITNFIAKAFDTGFVDVMPAWKLMSQTADEQGLPEIRAMATIVKIEAMHRVADAYGPIPYINFGSGSLTNHYDGLDEVYKKFFEELDESINVLTDYCVANASSPLLKKFDYIYEGDPVKWVKFANTLRLRLAIRVAYADPATAKIEAEKSISNPFGVIMTAADRASIKHSSDLVYYHPLFEIANNFNNGEIRMGASMDAYLNGYKDPRRNVYFQAATGDGAYHGVRLGITPSSWNNYKGAKVSNLNVNTTSEIVWMTAAESYFLRSEGALRGWNMGGDAKTLYNEGIIASFTENGIAAQANTYIANSTDKPAAFTDNVGSSNLAAPSTITIAWNDAATTEQKLERIITQKWIAIYPDGPEAWAEFRRTGYPKLFPVAVNNSSGTIDTNIQVRRIVYPEAEYTKNNEGVNSGVAKLGGQDIGGTKLWWDKK